MNIYTKRFWKTVQEEWLASTPCSNNYFICLLSRTFKEAYDDYHRGDIRDIADAFLRDSHWGKVYRVGIKDALFKPADDDISYESRVELRKDFLDWCVWNIHTLKTQ